MRPQHSDSGGKYESIESQEDTYDTVRASEEGTTRCNTESDSVNEYPSQRTKSGGSVFWRWLRANFLKVAQLIVLIDIAILLTIDVTATIAARVRKSKTCGHHMQDTSPETTPDFLDFTVQYEERQEWRMDMDEYSNPFIQAPSDDLDEAWDDLLAAKNFRVTADEVNGLHVNRTHRVRISNGDYVGVLGPYHQLHCLNIIRKLIHWDYYGPRMSEEERQSYLWKQHHSDHCLEVFRQSTMCHAYPTFYLGEWIADSREFPNIELQPATNAKCVDWNKLDKWARKRKLVEGEWKMKAGPYEKKHGDGDGKDMRKGIPGKIDE